MAPNARGELPRGALPLARARPRCGAELAGRPRGGAAAPFAGACARRAGPGADRHPRRAAAGGPAAGPRQAPVRRRAGGTAAQRSGGPLRRLGPRGLAEVPGLTDQRFAGRIERIGVDLYFRTPRCGFIRCRELAPYREECAEEEEDAFCFVSMREVRGFEAGDPVTFGVRLGPTGQLHARDLVPATEEEEASADRAPSEFLDLGLFACQVEALDRAKRLALLRGPEVQRLLGRTAVAHSGAIAGLSEGDQVSASLRLHPRGLLQAVRVEEVRGGGGPGRPRQARPRVERGLALAARPRESLGPPELAGLVWAYAAAAMSDAPCLKEILGFGFRFLPQLRPQALVSTAWALAILACGHQDLREALATISRQVISELWPAELSAIAWSCAQLPVRHEQVLQLIAARLPASLPDLRPRLLADVPWSFATLGVPSEPLFSALAAASLRRLSEIDAKNLRNTSWALTASACRETALLRAVAFAPRRGREGGGRGAAPPQECPGVRTRERLAPGRVGRQAVEVLGSRMATYMSQGDLDPHSVVQTAWACAVLIVQSKPFRTAISVAAQSPIASMSAQGCASMAWAVALLEYQDAPLLEAIAASALDRLSEYKKEQLSRTAWAYAFMRVNNETLMPAISAAALPRVSSAQSQCIANLAWAQAGLTYADAPLLAALSAAALRTITTFKTPELAGTVWATAVRPCCDAPLLDAIATQARAKIMLMPRDRLANTAWAFATLVFLHEPLMEVIADRAVRTLAEYRSRENGSLARSLWILCNDAFSGAWDLQQCQAALARRSPPPPGSLSAGPPGLGGAAG